MSVEKFIPDLKKCGQHAKRVAVASILQPYYGLDLPTCLHFRGATEHYSAFNRAHWGPYGAEFSKESSGGGVGFLFDLLEDGCYRAVFKTQRYKETSGVASALSFHIHEMGMVEHTETVNGGFSYLTVNLGHLKSTGGFWALWLTVRTRHADNLFAFYEASLYKLT